MPKDLQSETDVGREPEPPVLSPEAAAAAKARLVRTFVALVVFHFVLASVVAVVIFRRDGTPSPASTVRTAPFEIDRYVRNLSWSTPFLSSTPYRKGDELELAYFFETEFLFYHVRLKNPEFLNSFDVVSAASEGFSGSLDDFLSRTLTGRTSLSLKLKSKSNGQSDGGLPNFELERLEVSSENAPTEALTNPNAVRTNETAPSALASDASFSGAKLERSEYSSDINELVTVLNAPLGLIDSAVIGDRSFRGFYEGTSYRFVVDRATFAEGEYFIALSLSNGKLVPLSDKPRFFMDQAAVGIASVTPRSVSGKRDSYVVIQGRGLSKVVSLQLSNSLVIRNAAYSPLSDNVAVVRIPAGLPEGNYAFNVMDTQWISSPKRAMITVTK